MTETVQQYVERMLGLAGDGDPLEVLRGTAHRLAALITARSDEDLRYTSSPGRWSTGAILAHLADADVVASYRIRMILASPGVEIQAFDQNAWAAAFRYTNQDPFASLALFQSLRLAWLALLDAVAASEPDDSWRARYGVHQERGQESIGHLLRLYAGHDLNHVQQIERLLDERDRERGSSPPAFERRPIKPVIGS